MFTRSQYGRQCSGVHHTPVAFARSFFPTFVVWLNHSSAWAHTCALLWSCQASRLRSSNWLEVHRQKAQNIVALCPMKPDTLRLPSRSAIRGATHTCIKTHPGWWKVGICFPPALAYSPTDATIGSRRWQMAVASGNFGGGMRPMTRVFSAQKHRCGGRFKQ